MDKEYAPALRCGAIVQTSYYRQPGSGFGSAGTSLQELSTSAERGEDPRQVEHVIDNEA
jgi:hypothetical protein